jgi:2-C-methyl-D-erythritol 2,4-cyclodiphosphate synthase
MVRVGVGYDVHRLVVGRRLVLGGVEIPFEKGLDGHSDADVLLHAICDALFGAIGEGDIGQHFPNHDPRWRNVPSAIFLEEAARKIASLGGRIVNVDSSLLAERPKIVPHVPAMKAHIAKALGLQPAQVGVKATTNERLGFVGREEGMAAYAVACVEIKD